MNKQNKYRPEQVIQSSTMIQGVSTCYFLSNNENGYKAGSDCYGVFSSKKSLIHFSKLLLPYIILSSFISTIHVQAKSVICWSLSHQPPPKALR